MKKDTLLSIIVPAYNEENNIEVIGKSLISILDKHGINFEIIFVDDGSKDNTWLKIEDFSRTNSRVQGISFSRNFGKDSAIFAGMEVSRGDCVAVIDCDLQHPPEKLVEMYMLWKDGYQIIEGKKSDRGKESLIHKHCSNLFYLFLSRACGFDMMNASDFKLIDRSVVLVLLNIKEKNAFFRALSSWVGFRTTSIEFEVQERNDGVSKWSTRDLFKYALTNLATFSTAPMQIMTFLGIVLMLVSITLASIALIQKITKVALNGFTTVIIFQTFSSSIIMIGLGIIGFYLAKIYDEVKGRPRYIIDKKTK